MLDSISLQIKRLVSLLFLFGAALCIVSGEQVDPDLEATSHKTFAVNEIELDCVGFANC